jgi:hypothetical protein
MLYPVVVRLSYVVFSNKMCGPCVIVARALLLISVYAHVADAAAAWSNLLLLPSKAVLVYACITVKGKSYGRIES